MKILRMVLALLIMMLVFAGCDETDIKQAFIISNKTVISVPIEDNATMQFAANELVDYFNKITPVNYSISKE